MSEINLNLGCGNRKRTGFINIDCDSGIRPDLCLKLGEEELPFDNQSVSFVMSVHFIEHLSKKQGEFLLKEIDRVLKKDKIVATVFPDIRKMLDSGNSVYSIYNTVISKKINVDQLKEKSDDEIVEYFFKDFVNDSIGVHSYGYTEQTFIDLLNRVGEYNILPFDYNTIYDHFLSPAGSCGSTVKAKKI